MLGQFGTNSRLTFHRCWRTFGATSGCHLHCGRKHFHFRTVNKCIENSYEKSWKILGFIRRYIWLCWLLSSFLPQGETYPIFYCFIEPLIFYQHGKRGSFTASITELTKTAITDFHLNVLWIELRAYSNLQNEFCHCNVVISVRFIKVDEACSCGAISTTEMAESSITVFILIFCE